MLYTIAILREGVHIFSHLSVYVSNVGHSHQVIPNSAWLCCLRCSVRMAGGMGGLLLPVIRSTKYSWECLDNAHI